MKTPTYYFFVLILMVACRKDVATMPCTNPLDPACVNYHPCNAVQPVTADFEMWYGDNLQNKWVIEDSVFPPGAILFKAKLNGAQYKWVLGKDTEYVQKDYRFFDPKFDGDTSVYGTYYNTLTVWKIPNTACYPNDKSTATVTRSINIKRPTQLLTSGKFMVKFDGYADSNIIQIIPWYNDFPEPDLESPTTRWFIGFKGTEKDTQYVEGLNEGYFFGDKLIQLAPASNYYSLPGDGYIKVNPLDLTIEGNYKAGLRPYKQYYFKGRKL